MLLVALAAVNAAPVGEERHEEVPHKRDADDHTHKRSADEDDEDDEEVEDRKGWCGGRGKRSADEDDEEVEDRKGRFGGKGKRDADEDDEASEDDDEEGEDRLPSAVEGKCLNYSSQ